MRPYLPCAYLALLLPIFAAASVARAQEDAVGSPKNTIVFERIFGKSRLIAPERIAEVKALPAGEKLALDTNGDGQTDEAWYIDTAYRHDKEIILVRAVDEDGDFDKTGRPDTDSDLYFFDWDADGYIDVVADYVDDDGDNDVDQMGLYYNKNWQDQKDDMTVWWAMDIGDDNLLWYDVNGTYYQPLCQWRTHFSGDELFYQFRLTVDDEKWVNVWEDPFAFYDPDGDQASEVVVRVSAVGEAVKNLRYSIDADDDAYGRDTHNYDFSVTALPPAEGLSSAAWHTEALNIRGVDTLPLLPWNKTKEFGQQAKWGKAMLTWDEINSNTDEKPEQDPHERWEGILNAKSKHGDFEQVGGPPSSPFNKRVEVTAKPASPLALYFDEVDQRLHLMGAEYGYMDIDFNLDGVLDAAQTWKDEDGDGQLDTRAIDVNADGAIDIRQMLKPGDKTYALEFEALPGVYKPAIERALKDGQHFIDTATEALGSTPADAQAVIDYFSGPLADVHPETEIGQRIRNTPAGARFYVELARDKVFVAAKAALGEKLGWEKVDKAYSAGDYAGAAKELAKVASLKRDPKAIPALTLNGKTYTKRVTLVIGDHGSLASVPVLQDRPVAIDVDSLRAQAADFNGRDCAVVHGDRRVDWRVLAHQMDNWGHDGKEELTFVSDVPASGKTTFHVYYMPEGDASQEYPKLTNAVLDNPAYVAWESDAGAFRFYTGQFDFFGKQVQLKPRAERLIYPIIDVNYHAEQDWGIDALHVGKTSGLGGLTIYLDGKEYPVQSPAGEGHVTFEHKVLGSGPVRAAVEIIASNVFPDQPEKKVNLRCFIYARNAGTEINVQLPEGLEGATIAPGLMNLAEGVNGRSGNVLSVWGRQGDDIGEIGLALALDGSAKPTVQQLDVERRAVCKPDGNRFRYWILGGWRRGAQYPTSYGAENWQREADVWARQITATLKVAVK
ncbi:MAG: DUF4861 family protein [Candidatus Hydrogenedentes bacterium]|nr:DUF4861 family protein [Candidatus Hydrogenedentota bacterium]